MPTLTETNHTGEYLLSEGNGEISREQEIIVQPTTRVLSGTVLGRITASGKLAPYSNANADGTQTAVAILHNELAPRASAGDIKATVIRRSAEVMASRLTGYDTAAGVELAAVGIVVR